MPVRPVLFATLLLLATCVQACSQAPASRGPASGADATGGDSDGTVADLDPGADDGAAPGADAKTVEGADGVAPPEDTGSDSDSHPADTALPDSGPLDSGDASEDTAPDAGCGSSQPCGLGFACSPDGHCKPETCGETAYWCAGNAAKSCVGGQIQVFVCPGPCVNGSCCQPGATVCQGDVVAKVWCNQFPIAVQDCAEQGLQCWKGQCVPSVCSPTGGGPEAKPCTDSNPCTDDSCAAGSCVHVPHDGPCQDGQVCTVGDFCSQGTCMPGKPPVCDDGSPCTLDKCDYKVGCVFLPVAATCSDGDACTTADSCVNGACKGALIDQDGDGFAPVACGANDCNDKNASVHPGAPETCTPTGVDEDCDGETDESCDGTNAVGCDQDGDACGQGQGTCEGGHCLMTDAKGYLWTLVPAGPFWMGCDKTVDPQCLGMEMPRHPVQTSAYWIGVYEATGAQYQACQDAAKCASPWTGDSCTAGPGVARNCIPWGHAQAFCHWLGGELPSEAWWEKAARGGCEQYPGQDCAAAEPLYPWGNAEPVCGQQAVLMDPGTPGCGGKPQGVGTGSTLGSSPYGAFDMAGNVDEWTLDFEDFTFYGKPEASVKDPVNPVPAFQRVVRGGSWFSWAGDVRAARRWHGVPASGMPTTGVRCVKPAL